jgi:predicted nucleic acid-binding protein
MVDSSARHEMQFCRHVLLTTARSLGLRVTGTLGLLTIAHEQGLVELATVFERLKATNFRYRHALMDALLARYPNKTDGIG